MLIINDKNNEERIPSLVLNANPSKENSNTIVDNNDINYNRLYFNLSQNLAKKPKTEDDDIPEVLAEPPIVLGSDFYSFAMFAFYFINEDEKMIHGVQTKFD